MRDESGLECSAQYKNSIVKETFLYHCFKCQAAGNEFKMKTNMGDRVAGVRSQADAQQGSRNPDALPDVEAAHASLMKNEAAMAYLEDERGFSLEVIQSMKLGYEEHFFGAPVNKQRPSVLYPYFVHGNASLEGKARTFSIC